MYDIHIKIPNSICLTKGEIKAWFSMEKDKIRSYNEEYFKYPLIGEYYNHILE